MKKPSFRRLTLGAGPSLWIGLVWLLSSGQASARAPIRSTFFSLYPNAVGTVLDTVPSRPGHCGVCHYDFSGGGVRNPYGLAIQNAGFALNQEVGRSNAIYSVRLLDSDGDGVTNLVEITDNRLRYANTPTFPGYSPANTNLISNVALSDIAGFLTPVSGADTTPPTVQVLFPNGGQTFVANRPTNVTWSAADPSGVASVDLFASFDNGATYKQIARGLANAGVFSWVPDDRPTTQARFRVVAKDTYGNTGSDVSDGSFNIVSPPFTNAHGVATTLRDFDMPGTQPFEHGPELPASASCGSCHGGYNPAIEPYFNWQGGMMANASRDLLFRANLAIANQDAANSGDLCLRCHLPRGWLGGRSVPTDGSRMLPADGDGVTCALCHGLVNPVYTPGVSPTNDVAVLTGLSFPGTNYGNGMYVVDPSGVRRGPYTDALWGHPSLGSPFHRTAAFCGTCHDVSNPVFTRDTNGVYQPNRFDAPALDFSPHFMAPVERTYSEWLHSAYASDEGVFAPQFAGDRPGGRVSICQHCHMPQAAGYVADPVSNPGIPLRPDVGVHDLTGGSTWMPAMLTNLFPGEVNPTAIQAAINRSIRLLTNAASLSVTAVGGQLKVTVTNESGHKLPTGYPEGRRIWLNVKFYDEAGHVLAESGAYDFNTGVLTRDAHAKVYEVHPGIDTNISSLLGLEPAPSFHFVLNNKTYEDNRIPPRGFSNAAFATFGGEPVGHHYQDGQYWDDTYYPFPPSAVRAEVRLYYQSTSKEFVEFLRNQNRTDATGQQLYDLWNNHGKCPPTLMAQAVWHLPFKLQRVAMTPQGTFEVRFLCAPGYQYTIEFTDSLEGTPMWRRFVARGTFIATNTVGRFEDDFSPNTSGSPSPTGRFYRFFYTPAP